MININKTLLALCTDNEIKVYNKKFRKLSYKIPKHEESHEYSVIAEPISGMAKDKYLLWRD